MQLKGAASVRRSCMLTCAGGRGLEGGDGHVSPAISTREGGVKGLSESQVSGCAINQRQRAI